MNEILDEVCKDVKDKLCELMKDYQKSAAYYFGCVDVGMNDCQYFADKYSAKSAALGILMASTTYEELKEKILKYVK